MEISIKFHFSLWKIIFTALLAALLLFSCASGNHSVSPDSQFYTLIDQKRYAEAEEVAKNFLDHALEQYGYNHPEVARALKDLATVYHIRKRPAEAAQRPPEQDGRCTRWKRTALG